MPLLTSYSYTFLWLQLVFAAVGAIFTTGEYVTASIRQKEDPISAGVGGALVGVVPGMVKQSMRVGVASGVAAGAAMAAASYWYVYHPVCVWVRLYSDIVRCIVLRRQSSQDSAFDKYAAARHADCS